jgi:hypothetical protein
MTKTNQYPLYLTARVTDGADFVLELPPNALTVAGGQLNVLTVVAGTTPTITMTDNASAPATYLSAVALDALGDTAVAAAGIGNFYPAGGVLTGNVSAGASGGDFLVVVPYIIVGRSSERPFGAS